MADPLQNAPVRGLKKKRFPRAFGRFVLEKSLSRGGMGEVMLAIPKGVHKRVVIKTIRGDLTGDAEFVGRFADEAKIMVRIDHDNIIRVFDAGKVGGDYYIAMEYVHGRDLGDVLDRAYERGEPLPPQLGLLITSELLKGLDHVHGLTDETGRHMGLVHRDISPQNVLVGFDGSIKLIDFGLARTEVLPARTQGALAVGKYGYMSPEQARHEKIDGRADIYSSGVMLFEVFTGDRLVDEQDQATLWSRVLSPKHRNPRSVVPTLSREIDQLVMTAVGVKPQDRFQNAAEMLRFTDRLRTNKSTVPELIRYLRYLYPKVDFDPPPVPELEQLVTSPAQEEKSVIIATSREGAMSVFGRGELPIEWTRQIDADELRKELRRRRDRPDPNDLEVTQDERMFPPSGDRPGLGLSAPSQLSSHESFGSQDALTQVAVFDPTAEATSDGDQTAHMSAASPGVMESKPVRKLSSGISYRDDEMTVMMTAPPRPAKLDDPTTDDVTDDGEAQGAPTRLSRRPNDDKDKNDRNETKDKFAPTISAPPAATNTGRRMIKEKTSAHEKRRAKKPVAVHRQTVGATPKDMHSGSERTAEVRTKRPAPIQPDFDEASPSNKSTLLVVGLLLFGMAMLVAAGVLLMNAM